MIDLNLERLKRLPQNPAAVWEGGWRPLSNIAVATDKTPQDYHAGMWTCLENLTVGPRGDMLQPGHLATPEKLFELMVIFACDNDLAGFRPGLVRVDNKETALFLAEKLAGTGIEVAQAAELPSLDDLASHLATHLAGGGHGGDDVLSILASPDLTMEMIIDFGHAAAEFHKAAPWMVLADIDLISIVSPAAGPGLQFTSVLGKAGVEYGLGFFSDQAQHDAANSGASPEEIMNRTDPIWFFSFTDRTERDYRYINREWSSLGLPLNSPSAYPLFLCRLPDGRPHKPSPKELAFVTGLLRALARSTEEQMDTGRWSVTVPTIGGDMEFQLELPYVLKPLTLADRIRWGHHPDSRANQGLFDAIRTMIDVDDNATLVDHQAKIEKATKGRTFEEVIAQADLPDTNRQRAKDICYKAFDTLGYCQQVMARQALKEDPDCIDALGLLAEETIDPDRQLELCRQAIAAGRRILPLEELSRDYDDLFQAHEARPYLRCLAMAVDLLHDTKDSGPTLEYGLEFLKLHPVDSANIRHLVLPELLLADRNEEARALLDRWPGLDDEDYLGPQDEDDFMTGNGDTVLVELAGILLDLRAGVPAAELSGRVAEIQKTNRYVMPLMTKGKQPPATARQSVALSGGMVAFFVGMVLKDAWDQTPEAAGLAGGGRTATAKKSKKKRR